MQIFFRVQGRGGGGGWPKWPNGKYATGYAILSATTQLHLRLMLKMSTIGRNVRCVLGL